MENVQVMYSQNNKKLLVVNNFKYFLHYKSKKSNLITWRCIDKKCSSKVYTLNDVIDKVKSVIIHNHQALETLNRQIVSNSTKRKTKSD